MSANHLRGVRSKPKCRFIDRSSIRTEVLQIKTECSITSLLIIREWIEKTFVVEGTAFEVMIMAHSRYEGVHRTFFKFQIEGEEICETQLFEARCEKERMIISAFQDMGLSP